MPYGRVVVGTDGSPSAAVAITHAAALAIAFDAELVVVTAFDANAANHTLGAEPEAAPDDVRWRITNVGVAEDRANEARRLAHEAGVRRIRVRAEQGDPAQVLVDVALDVGADCIVVGSKGMASPSRFLLGSVPNTVSHHAPCDVLIVHTVP